VLSPYENDDFLRESVFNRDADPVCICDANVCGKTGALAVVYCEECEEWTDTIAEKEMDRRDDKRGFCFWIPSITTADMYRLDAEYSAPVAVVGVAA
jgi:hypothetical protein